MLRTYTQRSFFVTLLLLTAACTQPAAQIELKGQNSYNREGGSYASNNASSYSSYRPSAGASSYSASNNSYVTGSSSYNAPVHTESTAAVSSIGVSDLNPPTHNTPATNKAAAAPATKPFASASQPLPSDNVNPWTHKPRTDSATTTTAASNALDNSFHLSPKTQPTTVKQQMVADVQTPPASTKAVQLDSIVSNDEEGAVAKTAEVTKKVKNAEVASSGFMWPVNTVISDFGPKGKGKVNEGINIASAAGEPVWASADGEVVYVGNELQGYGNIVIIKHSGDKTSTYAHLNRYTVDKYDRIKQGDIIGYVGTTGTVKDPQLHFVIRDGKDAVDPMKYLGRNVASLH